MVRGVRRGGCSGASDGEGGIQERQGVTQPFFEIQTPDCACKGGGQKNGGHWAPAISTKAQQEQKCTFASAIYSTLYLFELQTPDFVWTVPTNYVIMQ